MTIVMKMLGGGDNMAHRIMRKLLTGLLAAALTASSLPLYSQAAQPVVEAQAEEQSEMREDASDEGENPAENKAALAQERIGTYAAGDITREQAVAWINNQKGRFIDKDGAYGAQCVDFIIAYFDYLGVARIWGNAKDYAGKTPPSGWQSIKGAAIQGGDIVIWTNGTYGHVALAISDSQIMEQNRSGQNSASSNVSPCEISNMRWSGYWGVWRPNFKSVIPDDSWREPGVYMDSGYYPVIPDGDYHIVSALGDKWWLTNAGFSMDDGGNVQLWDYDGMGLECEDHVYNFQFIKGAGGRGFYRIKNLKSGKYLDSEANDHFLYRENGKRTNLQQWSYADVGAQQWAVNEVNCGDRGMMYTFQARCSSYYIDLEDALAASGTNISMWPGNDSDAQRWRLIPYAPSIGRTIADGEYRIVSKKAENKAIGFAGNSARDGVNVELSTVKGDYSQTFDVAYLGNGYYRLTNNYANRCLDAADGSRKLQTNVQLWTRNDAAFQQNWIIKSCGSGYYNLISRFNSLYLDLHDTNTADGTNIELWKGYEGDSQKWKFIPYEKPKTPAPTPSIANGATVEPGAKLTLDGQGADEIYYTLDGTDPTKNSAGYDAAAGIILPAAGTACTVKALAVKAGYLDSDVMICTYAIKQKGPNPTPDPTPDPVVVGVPTAEPVSGTTVDRGSYVSLTADVDADIYYTMDGSDPADSARARLYEKKIYLDGDPGSVIVIKAVSKKKGVYGETGTFRYTISDKTVRGLRVTLAGSDAYLYTGKAIKPAVIVSNNGAELLEGTDYTLRYSNNINAADKNARKAPTVTVTGKGNLTKSVSIPFTILQKDIGDEDVIGGGISVVSGKTAVPALFYMGVKLTTKDYTNPDAKKKYMADGTMTITGKGNFTGTREITVRVAADQKSLKKFSVVIDSKKLKKEPLVYDGTPKTMQGYFEVYDTKDTKKESPLEEYSDYEVIYPREKINAGVVKFTVVGIGEYSGTVVKSYSILPKTVKTADDGDMVVNIDDGEGYPFTGGKVTIPDLTVSCDGRILTPGKDYLVTYRNNKKVCFDNRAECRISFIGNYKGSKTIVRKFHITPAVMDDVEKLRGTVSVAIADMIYTGKPGTYRSTPYVTVNGVLLKSSDYKVSYYKDADREQKLDGKGPEGKIDLADGDSRTVYVTITGKGNYEGEMSAQYNVCKLKEDAVNLSKTRITFPGGNRVNYTGEGLEPALKIEYKSGKTWKEIDPDDIDEGLIKITYINNVAKGKATVMISGNGPKYVGGKTAAFRIVSKIMTLNDTK